jgi:hypothetical protein
MIIPNKFHQKLLLSHFLTFYLRIGTTSGLSARLFDKGEDINVAIIKSADLDSNIPNTSAYDILSEIQHGYRGQ